MKLFTLNIFAILVLATSCNSTKKENTTSSDDIKTEVVITDNETPFKDTKWKLVTFMGNDVSDKNAFITFSSKDNKVYGNASCNSFNGSYKLGDGFRVSLSKIATTLMACPDMSTETAFLEILEKVDNYSLNGTKMTLNKARMAPYAVFEADK
ncbi:META domain-containing protein [Psychroserpens sp. AS72]|uniref:META domain-containing protein n=1 Tax=Psychroserpens sp. AS72 TaxID=3135775 RepID=UPI003178DCD2